MSEFLHIVTITGDEKHPKIEFTCHGDRDAECHSYPDCDCEIWFRDEHPHEFVPHDHCWMKSFFDNPDDGAIAPMPEYLAEDDIHPGASGPISTSFNGEYIEWEFLDA